MNQPLIEQMIELALHTADEAAKLRKLAPAPTQQPVVTKYGRISKRRDFLLQEPADRLPNSWDARRVRLEEDAELVANVTYYPEPANRALSYSGQSRILRRCAENKAVLFFEICKGENKGGFLAAPLDPDVLTVTSLVEIRKPSKASRRAAKVSWIPIRKQYHPARFEWNF